jgi:hypothetical protein
MITEIKATPLQEKILAIPETYNLALLGGRGGGKTYAVGLLVLRHLNKYGEAARVLVCRENYAGLRAIEELMEKFVMAAFPDRVKFNRNDHLMRVEGSGQIEFQQIDGPGSISKMLGRECTLLVIEEAGLLREWRWMQLLKTNLRSPVPGMILRTVFTGNPGSYQHTYLFKTHIATRQSWVPYTVEGEQFVTIASTLKDNPHLDPGYETRLRAGCAGDPELAEAYVNGLWNLQAGFFFGLEWDANVHVLPRDLPFPIHAGWYPRLALDHGTTAPNVTLFAGECPGDVPGIPKGSTVVFDESTDVDWSDVGLNTSHQWPLGKIAENILAGCRQWQMFAQGVADDSASFDARGDSLIEVYRREFNISFTKPASKGRRQSLAIIKMLLANAAARNGKPGLYISERCPYLIATLPTIMRDPRDREDIDTKSADHAIDSLRYHLLSPPRIIRIGYNNGW